LLDTVVQQIAETMGDACTIRMLSDDQQVFSLVASYHPDPEIVRDLRSLAAAERHIAIPGTHKDVLETGQSRLIPRLDPDHLEGLMPPESQRFVQRHRVHSLLVVPLRVQGQTIGMISIARQEHHAPYTSEDQIALQDVADQLARSITNARLHEAVQQAHSELEQRVDERTRELSVSNERLRQEISQRSRIEHALRESEARYRLLADHATDLVFRSTLEGVILYASPACRTMLGYEPHEMVGQSAYVFTHPDDYEHIGARISEMVQNRSVQVTSCRMLHKQGHVVWVEIAAQCTYDAQTGEPQEIIGIDRDITERKQAEEEIQRLHHTVQQRAQELEAANRELEAFSYSVSHDLQTPLRVVDGFCEILTELAPPTLPAAMLHYIERIRHNVQRMQQLIDGLLTLSQLSRQQLSYQRVEVAVLAQQVYNEIRQSYPAQQSELVLGNVPACQADPLLLRQVLANFMSNAFKFTRTRTISYIEVGAQQDEDSDDTIYYVRDNGIGFDSRHATRIFGLFQRLHRPEEFAGTGAGLAIAQRIIHRHGGRIWAEAEVNQGATFYFTLPRDG
jgi:PAS domain S-box-containing protein